MRILKNAAIHAALRSGAIAHVLKWRRSNPLILMYHGVSTTQRPAESLRNVDEKHIPLPMLAQQLKTLRKRRRVISLSEMVEGFRKGEDLRNTVAITFDDGYQNNFSHAAPLLSDMNLPAAFFLATGYIDTDSYIWTDRVETIVDRTSAPSVRVPDGDRALPLAGFDQRRKALREVKAALKKLPGGQLSLALEALEGELKVERDAASGDQRFMTWQEARQMAAAGFEMGAHTVNHPILSRLPLEDAKREIIESRDMVAKQLGRCSTTFCYPNGKSSDYTEDVKAFCKGAFEAALSTNRGPARAGEMYELRRFGTSGSATDAYIEWTLLRER